MPHPSWRQYLKTMCKYLGKKNLQKRSSVKKIFACSLSYNMQNFGSPKKFFASLQSDHPPLPRSNGGSLNSYIATAVWDSIHCVTISYIRRKMYLLGDKVALFFELILFDMWDIPVVWLLETCRNTMITITSMLLQERTYAFAGKVIWCESESDYKFSFGTESWILQCWILGHETWNLNRETWILN